jgi:hypothetical protein
MKGDYLTGLTLPNYPLPEGTPPVAGLSALAMWVGWTMMTTESDMPEPELEMPPPP